MTGVILLANQAVNKLYVVLWVVITGNNHTITLQLNMKQHSQQDHLHGMASLAHRTTTITTQWDDMVEIIFQNDFFQLINDN